MLQWRLSATEKKVAKLSLHSSTHVSHAFHTLECWSAGGLRTHSHDSTRITCQKSRNKCRNSSRCYTGQFKRANCQEMFFFRQFEWETKITESWGWVKQKLLFATQFNGLSLSILCMRSWGTSQMYARRTRTTGSTNATAHGKLNDCIIFTRCTCKLIQFCWASLFRSPPRHRFCSPFPFFFFCRATFIVHTFIVHQWQVWAAFIKVHYPKTHTIHFHLVENSIV